MAHTSVMPAALSLSAMDSIRAPASSGCFAPLAYSMHLEKREGDIFSAEHKLRASVGVSRRLVW